MKGDMNVVSPYAIDRRYIRWKSQIPLLYDWFTNHNLTWPSLTCRWGPRIDQTNDKYHQRLYISEQTDGSAPNTLIVANCEIIKSRVALEAHNMTEFNEDDHSPHVKKYKSIIHPGEVNRIRELPQNPNLVATHTDDRPEVLMWDTSAQPARHALPGAPCSRPNLVLTGHIREAEYALAMCATEPYVLSGGYDRSVILWRISDDITSLATTSNNRQLHSVFGANTPSLAPRGIFHGHLNTVEDVHFSPSSPHEFCSVGDDAFLNLWDSRVGSVPILQVQDAHLLDILSVSWNMHDNNLILTGSADKSVHIYDRRILNNNRSDNIRRYPVYKFKGHDRSVVSVMWNPDRRSVFGTAAEDGIVNIWDYEKVGRTPLPYNATPNPNPSPPPGLIFRHGGHRKRMVEFQWNPWDPWTVVSVSNDYGLGGGTLQIWRMIDLMHENASQEDLDELYRFRPCTTGHNPMSLKNLSFSYLP